VSDENQTEWRVIEAKSAFNRAWVLIEKERRSDPDNAEMLITACASRYLWNTVGEDEQRFVGDWQIAHVASLLGEARLALQFAASALARVESNGWTDWRLASALEGLARAHAAAGDTTSRDHFAERCRQVLDVIDEAEDRDLIAGQLESVPGVMLAE
jgi:hypothetical protein